MTRRIRAITGVAVMSCVLVIYVVFVGVRAFALLASSSAIAVTMGVALLVLPAFALWGLVRELRFGAHATRLIDRLAAAALLPEDLSVAIGAGESKPPQPDTRFAAYRLAAETQPDDWQAWARLGIVYDAYGDRGRARRAMRIAIARARERPDQLVQRN